MDKVIRSKDNRWSKAGKPWYVLSPSQDVHYSRRSLLEGFHTCTGRRLLWASAARFHEASLRLHALSGTHLMPGKCQRFPTIVAHILCSFLSGSLPYWQLDQRATWKLSVNGPVTVVCITPFFYNFLWPFQFEKKTWNFRCIVFSSKLPHRNDQHVRGQYRFTVWFIKQ